MKLGVTVNLHTCFCSKTILAGNHGFATDYQGALTNLTTLSNSLLLCNVIFKIASFSYCCED